ncbi:MULTISPECIES: hypothetical protein [Bacillus]|uniref:hypothetical protein n=1 Tax=Bacillus TaxID=1386 RepID=UPI0015E0EE59|nr:MULTISPECIES: hypothetical protein [Bacillus]
MNEYKVVVKDRNATVLEVIITAEDERDVLGNLLLRSELFNQSFTDIRILER